MHLQFYLTRACLPFAVTGSLCGLCPTSDAQSSKAQQHTFLSAMYSQVIGFVLMFLCLTEGAVKHGEEASKTPYIGPGSSSNSEISSTPGRNKLEALNWHQDFPCLSDDKTKQDEATSLLLGLAELVLMSCNDAPTRQYLTWWLPAQVCCFPHSSLAFCVCVCEGGGVPIFVSYGELVLFLDDDDGHCLTFNIFIFIYVEWLVMLISICRPRSSH